MEETNIRRIVILGKTGSGKSSLANTIFDDEEFRFRVNNSPNSGTKKCQSELKSVNGRSIRLIDTPGLFDTDPRSTDLSPEILKCIIECAPGAHAFLLVFKVDKFTEQEQAVVEKMVKYFTEEALKYTTVVFTRGDDLPEGMKIEDWVSQNEALKDLVQKCSGRCHVFDSKYWNKPEEKYRNNKVQVEELLKTIDKTVRENRGGYYTNEMLQMVEIDLEREKDNIRKSANLSASSIEEKAKQNVFKKWLTKLASVSVGVLLGALVGVPVMVVTVIRFFKPQIADAADAVVALESVEKVVEGVGGVVVGAVGGVVVGAVGAVGGVVGGIVVGGCIGYHAETPGEAAKTILNKADNILSGKQKKI